MVVLMPNPVENMQIWSFSLVVPYVLVWKQGNELVLSFLILMSPWATPATTWLSGWGWMAATWRIWVVGFDDFMWIMEIKGGEEEREDLPWGF
jgi:hypothetical protein